MYKPTAIDYSDNDQTSRMNAFDGERTALLLLVNEKQKRFTSKKRGMNKVDFSVRVAQRVAQCMCHCRHLVVTNDYCYLFRP